METPDSREKLVAEKEKLESELSRIAVRSPKNPNHWETKPAALDTDEADEGEEGFALQQFEQNAAITADLETRLNEVIALLDQTSTES